MSASRLPLVPTALVVMGVSGSGKSTLASALAQRLRWTFVEGDDLHAPASIAKMASGTPLDDGDRQPWLDRIAARLRHGATSGRPLVVTCSALRRAHRDTITMPGLVFVHLHGTTAQVTAQLEARTGHFMPLELLTSQESTLEPLQPDEPGLAVEVGRSPDDLVGEVVRTLGLEAVKDAVDRADTVRTGSDTSPPPGR